MGNNWTPEQLEAIMQRDCNLLVAAAAGAGKTAVLVERIIRKITDSKKPVDIDRLLVVTFTNAAATEMRERIGNALINALDADPASANLQNQMALLDRASIMTLHSFCLEVVRSNFHTLDLDPGFRISDETESTLMRLDALEELFEDKYENEEAGSDFFQLVDSYGGGRDDNELREIVLSLHKFTRSHPWPEQWLAAQTEAFNIGSSVCLSSTPWARVLLASAAAELQGLLALLDKAAALASRAPGLEPYCGVLASDMQMLGKLLYVCQDAAPDWDAIHAAFASCEPARLPRCGKDADANVQDEVKAIRNQMKDKLKKLCESGFNLTSAELFEDYRRLYPLFKYLSAMVCEFDGLYSQKKNSKALLDFNDLEHHCLKVLIEDNEPTAAALELRKRYEEILVDEYQDSNLIQELILGTISGNRDGRFNIFMVGDVKQSIYRFRQAKPELFLSKYSAYPHESGHTSRVIQLYKNFRSRSSVIDGVNFIFRQVMSSLVGELDYTDEEALNPGAVFEEAAAGCNTGGPIELHIIDVTSNAVIPEYGQSYPDNYSETPAGYSAENSTGTPTGYSISNSVETPAGHSTSNPAGNPGKNSSSVSDAGNPDNDDGDGTEENEEEPLDNIQAEARITGKRIRELVSLTSAGLSIYDKKLGNYRKAQYRDIVILMRATRNWADVFVDELAAMGIPAYADTGLGYFRTVEVETMLSLMQIIDNPLQDIPLLAVLRSPIGGFNSDELADIRLADRTVSYFEAMRLFAGAIANPSEECSNSETRQKTGKFLEELHNWRDIAQFTPTDELVWKLLTDTGYYSYVGVLPGGPERKANLRMLFERARQYEETSYKGLFNFINFINKLRSGGGDMGSARILGENDNVVRIMSIHKSKGLEFPVVIVSGCGRKFNLRDLNASILLHQELGYGPDIVDLEKRTVAPSLSKFAIRQKLRLETLSEEMRILYVAFTRAREKLIMTGCIRDVSRACFRWCSAADVEDSGLPPYNMQQAATYLEWLGPALVRHESAEPLRMAAAPHGDIKLLKEDGSSWDIKLWGMGAAAVEKEAALAVENIRQWLEYDELANGGNMPAEPGYSADELIKKLEWEYPFRTLSGMPAKLSVTELKRRFAAEEQIEQQEAASPYIQPMTARPAFLEPERGLDAARRGSVMHFIMQHLDFKRLASLKGHTETGITSKAGSKDSIFHHELESQLASMEAKEQLTAAEAKVANITAIGAFFETSLGKRMLEAKSVRRETAFNIEIKCTDIYRDLPQDIYDAETMLVQGVIDCWFEADEGIVLLDYKTDCVPAGGTELIKERYRVQLDYYTRALEQISGKKVTERYLYLFHSGELLNC
jgi:ATP-dependent helicase/nuclease subunit A